MDVKKCECLLKFDEDGCCLFMQFGLDWWKVFDSMEGVLQFRVLGMAKMDRESHWSEESC